MEARQQLIRLIQQMDQAIVNSCMDCIKEEHVTLANDQPIIGRRGNMTRCIVKMNRCMFEKNKILLLQLLNETFIDSTTKAIRLSALTIFCYTSGIELITHIVVPNTFASFTLRMYEFDIVVNNGLK